MRYNPRTGITSFSAPDPATDPNATVESAAAVTPSTATAPAPAPKPAAAKPAAQGFFADPQYVVVGYNSDGTPQYDQRPDPFYAGLPGGYEGFLYAGSQFGLPENDFYGLNPQSGALERLYRVSLPSPAVVDNETGATNSAPGMFGSIPFFNSSMYRPNPLLGGHRMKYSTGDETEFARYFFPNDPAIQQYLAQFPTLDSGIYAPAREPDDRTLGADVATQIAVMALVGNAAGGLLSGAGAGASAYGPAEEAAALGAGDIGVAPTLPGMLSAGTAGLAGNAAAKFAVSGGDPASVLSQEALKNLAVDYGIGTGINAASSAFSAPADGSPDLSGATELAGEPWKRRGMFSDPLLLAQTDTGNLSDAIGIAGLNELDLADVGAPYGGIGAATGEGTALATADSDVVPIAGLNEMDLTDVGAGGGVLRGSVTGGMLPVGDLNGPGPSEQPKPPTEAEQRAQQAAKYAERIAKFGRALAQLHDGQGQPEDAPQRQDDQSNADYSQTLVQYANLDPQALADQGLTPGTPEYYQYVMDQMDAIINQVTNGVDENGKDLAQQLRGKTREELDALERALFVRGQMNQLMGSGHYTDPVSGTGQDVVAPKGKQVNPALAAYTTGLARSADELARMTPGEASRFIGGMLDRNPDLYGMQARADARGIEEALAQQDIFDPMKRRSGAGMSPDYWRALLDEMSPQQLWALLQSFESDPDRGRAALAQLVG